MKKCYNCERKNRDNDKYCRNCGYELKSNTHYVLINIGSVFAIIILLFVIALFIASFVVD